TSASAPASNTYPSWSQKPARSTGACLSSSVPAKAVPSALRFLSASTSPTQGGTNAPWLWPARFVHSSTPSPASPTKTFAGRSPDCSAPLHQRPHELRPAPPAPARTHPAPAPQQPLRPHRRGHPRRRLLHQAPQPAAATLLGADRPTAPLHIRRALATLQRSLDDYITT